jgi:PAS domain S-box-containing protein
MSQSQTHTELPLPRAAAIALAAVALTGGALLAIGPGDYPDLHTILDTSLALLLGVVALLLWDMGQHAGTSFPKWLAITFAATFVLAVIHVLVTVEWSGSMAVIARSKMVLRPATWPPATHLLPIGVGWALWRLRRGVTGGMARYALVIIVLGAGLFVAFQHLPTYLPPGLLGVTRPALVLAPLLWAGVGVAARRLRALDRLAGPLAWMAGTLVVTNVVMLYSRAPADGPAMVAHLGRAGGFLVLLLSAIQVASRDMLERISAETALSRLNTELDQRVVERTAQLETTNAALEEEMRARRQGQRLLDAIIESSPAVIYVKDLEGRYLMVNRRYADIFHIDRDAMIGSTDHDIFSKEVADAFRAMDVRVAAADLPLTEEEEAPHDDGPHAYISVKSPLRDEAGQAYAVFGISTDITERKRAETRLRTQFERLSLLDEITRAIGQRQDIQSIFQVVVRSVEDQLPADFACLCLYDDVERALTVAAVGVNSQALAFDLAMPVRARVDIDQNGLSQCVGGRLVYEPDIAKVRFPFPQRLAGGGLGSMVCAPLQIESKVFGVLVVARFQSEAFVSGECEFLRQLSEHVALAAHQAQLHGALQAAYDDLRQSQQAILQQERLKALGQMASGIAHDINNALSPVALYTESMLETETGLSPNGRGRLEVIRRAVEDVSQTIARMKEFYRQREPHLALAAVTLNDLVQQVVDLTRARWSDMAMERGVVIEVRVEQAVDLPAVLGVESEIREALINLVLNAVDAIPEGGLLTLRTRLAGDAVAVEVQDNGVGMDEETRRRCLEPFFTTKGERGTGLGLAMVYGVIQRHGAEMDIRPAPGGGTLVSLSFPVPAHVSTPTGEAVAPVLPSRLRLLLIDDDPVLLKALGDTLEADGHQLTIANDGQAGIDAFSAAHHRGEAFAAVITDLGMPYVDGRKVAAAIKALSPSMPVLLLTGWGQGLAADAEISPHVDRILSKPPKLRELRAALAQHCPAGEG